MNVIDLAIEWAKEIANDNSHGYSQQIRWGPSYDCSSLVISAYDQAFGKFNQKGPTSFGASYTGNMYNSFKECGFVDVSSLINFNSGTGLKKGDVLLNHQSHTVLYIGNNEVVNARSSEGTSNTIDDSGNEIRIQKYWNFPWDCVLRLYDVWNTDDSDHSYSGLIEDDGYEEAEDNPYIPYHSKGYKVAMLQGALKYFGYNLGWYGIDGDSGGKNSYTNIGLRSAVSDKNLTKEFIQDFYYD